MRVLTRLVTALLGLALMVAGLGLALEVLLAWNVHHPVLVPYDRWLSYARGHTWRDPAVRGTSLAVLVLGVLLLLLALRRRAPLVVPGAPRPAMTVTFARRPLESALGRLAVRTSGVEGVRVRVRRRTVAVSGKSLASDLKSAGGQLSASLHDGLERLPLASTPRVDARLGRARS